MAVQYESDGGVVFAASNSNAAITVPLPATRPTGSVLLLIGFSRLITDTVGTAPSGYTSLSGAASGTAAGGKIVLYAKAVVGGETAPTFAFSSAVTGNSGDLWGAIIVCYSGVNTVGGVANILEVSGAFNDASGTTTCTYPALTTSNVNSMLLRFLARFRDAADTFTPTATWNEREDIGSTTRTGAQFHLQDKFVSGTGSQASVTVAPSNTTAARYLAMTLSLHPPPVISQAQFRFRNDDGDEAAASWKAALNTAGGTIDADSRFRLRVTIDETGGTANPAAETYKLQHMITAGGSWLDVSSSAAVRPDASPNVADAAATTQQLSSGLGTFVAGSFDEVDGAVASVDLAAGGVTELEWALKLDSGATTISPGDTIFFRVVTTAGGLVTYDQTPSLTVGLVARKARVYKASLEVPEASGASWTASPADTVALADSISPVKGVGRSASPADTVVLADSLSRVVAKARTVADPVVLADARSLTRTVARTIADSVTLADTPVAAEADQAQLADTVLPTDARALARGKAISDSVVLADTVVAAEADQAAISDTVVPADSLSRVVAKARTVADPVALSDSCSPVKTGGAVNYTRTPADSVVLADTLVAAEADQAAVTDSIALADSLTRSTATQRTIADTVALTDARAIAKGKGVTDTLLLADLLSRARTADRALGDSVVLADTRALVQANAITIGDGLALADSFSRTAVYARAPSDQLALADAANASTSAAWTRNVSLVFVP